jgi:hypothetical protein
MSGEAVGLYACFTVKKATLGPGPDQNRLWHGESRRAEEARNRHYGSQILLGQEKAGRVRLCEIAIALAGQTRRLRDDLAK